MSEQTQKEKIKIAIEDSQVPSAEVSDIVSEELDKKKAVWVKDDKSDFWNVVVKGVMDRLAPTFVDIIQKEVDKPENSNKRVQFTFKGFLFGHRTQNGFDMLWRLKPSGGGGGSSGGGGKFPPSAVEEVFIGTWTDANMVLQKTPDKKWYIVSSEMVVNPNVADPNDPNFAVGFVTMKRNKSFKPE